MHGAPDPQLAMLTTLSTEELVSADHPIRRIRAVVDAVLVELDDVFDGMYAARGRASVPPETLLKSTVLMAMYSIRSERAFCERLNYDLLFKWFLDMRIDQPAFDAATFTKNRKRLREHEHRVLLHAEDEALTHRQLQLRHDLRAEREKLATGPGRASGPATELHHAIARRQTTVVHDPLTRPPGWLIRWLTELNDQGTLIQLPDRDLHEQIAEIGHYRDPWDITRPEPLGRPPSPALPQFRDWQQLAVRIEPPGTARAIGHDVDLVRP